MDPATLTRFESKITQVPAGCWVWTAATTKCGYGHLKVSGAMIRAHRLAWEHFVGPIPDGLQVEHGCHTVDPSCAGGVNCPHRRCVNPDHLELVTTQENTRRGLGFAGINVRKTHCVNGHEFTVDNTALVNTGRGRKGRRCLTCRSERARAA